MTSANAASAAPGAVDGLAVRDALVRRGEFTVSASFAVGRGRILALTGANGTGKTTLLHAVAGLLPLASGEVALDGGPLDAPGPPPVWVEPEARGIGLVPQRHVLFGHLAALENVAFGLRARGERRGSARAAGRAWLARVGLDGVAHLRAARLSGGQSQRVALARALCPGPRLLLLDEPFASLDRAARTASAALVRELVDDLALPAVLVTHDEREVEALADDVLHLGA